MSTKCSCTRVSLIPEVGYFLIYSTSLRKLVLHKVCRIKVVEESKQLLQHRPRIQSNYWDVVEGIDGASRRRDMALRCCEMTFFVIVGGLLESAAASQLAVLERTMIG